MFVSFLMPYVDRGQGPLFQGLMLQQLAALGSSELMFVADRRYFDSVPAPWGEQINAFGFTFRCPSQATFHATPRHVLPDSIFADLDQQTSSMLHAFHWLLTEDYPPLRQALEQLFNGLSQRQRVEAILTWCNCPSLTRAATALGLPVIHNELGPLRKPFYAGTVYFDFQGVNGRTSAAAGMQRFAADVGAGFEPLSVEQLRTVLLSSPPNAPAGRSRFPVGAVLQVEDDSNLLAYGNRWTNFELIFAARRGRRPQDVLIRKHPRGYAVYSDQLGALDDSPHSIAFLERCEQVYTINSSLAFECLLHNTPFTMLGDSPAAPFSQERLPAMNPEMRLRCLNFLFLGYLVPETLLFDREYYRWRLTQPTPSEIYQRHLEVFTGRASRQVGSTELIPQRCDQGRPTGGQPQCSGAAPSFLNGSVASAAQVPPLNGARPTGTILFVSHEASRTGAPAFLLGFIRWLRQHTSWNIRILLRTGGPLEEEFRALGETILGEECGSGLFDGVALIYSNTCTNGSFLHGLKPPPIPILTHVHELDYVIDWFGPDNFRRSVEQTHHFLACAEAVAHALTRRPGIGSNNVSVCPEAISVAEIESKASQKPLHELRNKHGIGTGTVTIAACACADWRKGPDLFLQVANVVVRRIGNRFPLKFLWLGLLPADERGRLLTRDLELLGLADTLEFVGELENPYPHLQMCDLFCLCSREDPFPLAMLEAAALGKPLVCFEKAGGAPEFCAFGGGFAVPYLDVDAMATRLIELIEDETLRRTVGQRAACVVRKHFDMEVIGPRVLEVIQRWVQPVSGGRTCALEDRAQLAQPAAPQTPASNPNQLEALRKTAAAQVQQERYAEAAESYGLILRQAPKDSEALLGQACCHQAQGHIVLAELLFDQLLELQPGHPEARRLLNELRGDNEQTVVIRRAS